MFVDPNTVHNPTTGSVAPAAWGDVIRDDLMHLADPPQCSVRASTPQTIADNTLTILTAETESYDTDAMHSTITNTSRITAQTAGRYSVEACVNWATGTGFEDGEGATLLNFLVNGTTGVNCAQLPAVNSDTFSTAMSGVRSITLDVGDYVEVRVRHQEPFATDRGCTLEEFRLKWDSV
jgi:hypothetical protein